MQRHNPSSLLSTTELTNAAQRDFTSRPDDIEPGFSRDCRDFNSWYHLEDMERLVWELHHDLLNQKVDNIQLINDIYMTVCFDGYGNFAELMRVYKEFLENSNKHYLFSVMKPELGAAHYVVCMLKKSVDGQIRLFYFDPTGGHEDARFCKRLSLASAVKVAGMPLVRSRQRIQDPTKERGSLVSCGPLCIEFIKNFLNQDRLNHLNDQLALPEELLAYGEGNESAYQSRISTLRLSHYQRLGTIQDILLMDERHSNTEELTIPEFYSEIRAYVAENFCLIGSNDETKQRTETSSLAHECYDDDFGSEREDDEEIAEEDGSDELVHEMMSTPKKRVEIISALPIPSNSYHDISPDEQSLNWSEDDFEESDNDEDIGKITHCSSSSFSSAQLEPIISESEVTTLVTPNAGLDATLENYNVDPANEFLLFQVQALFGEPSEQGLDATVLETHIQPEISSIDSEVTNEDGGKGKEKVGNDEQAKKNQTTTVLSGNRVGQEEYPDDRAMLADYAREISPRPRKRPRTLYRDDQAILEMIHPTAQQSSQQVSPENRRQASAKGKEKHYPTNDPRLQQEPDSMKKQEKANLHKAMFQSLIYQGRELDGENDVPADSSVDILNNEREEELIGDTSTLYNKTNVSPFKRPEAASTFLKVQGENIYNRESDGYLQRTDPPESTEPYQTHQGFLNSNMNAKVLVLSPTRVEIQRLPAVVEQEEITISSHDTDQYSDQEFFVFHDTRGTSTQLMSRVLNSQQSLSVSPVSTATEEILPEASITGISPSILTSNLTLHRSEARYLAEEEEPLQQTPSALPPLDGSTQLTKKRNARGTIVYSDYHVSLFNKLVVKHTSTTQGVHSSSLIHRPAFFPDTSVRSNRNSARSLAEQEQGSSYQVPQNSTYPCLLEIITDCQSQFKNIESHYKNMSHWTKANLAHALIENKEYQQAIEALKQGGIDFKADEKSLDDLLLKSGGSITLEALLKYYQDIQTLIPNQLYFRTSGMIGILKKPSAGKLIIFLGIAKNYDWGNYSPESLNLFELASQVKGFIGLEALVYCVTYLFKELPPENKAIAIQNCVQSLKSVSFCMTINKICQSSIMDKSNIPQQLMAIYDEYNTHARPRRSANVQR